MPGQIKKGGGLDTACGPCVYHLWIKGANKSREEIVAGCGYALFYNNQVTGSSKLYILNIIIAKLFFNAYYEPDKKIIMKLL